MNEYTKQERIKKNGEIFTPDNIVNDMLDMLEESYPLNIDTTVLEPTCGDGQILIRLLYRKLLKVISIPVEQRELALLRAVSSIYGVDISERNVNLSKTRLKSLIYGYKIDTFSTTKTEKVSIVIDDVDLKKIEPAVNFILNNNILLGNTLETDEFDSLFVYLTSYNWNTDGTVTTHKCPLTNLDDERDEKTFSYLDISNTEHIETKDYIQLKEDKSTVTTRKASTFGLLGFKFG